MMDDRDDGDYLAIIRGGHLRPYPVATEVLLPT